MLLNELFEISANPDYLRAAERSRSQARDTQRQYWRSPEEKAAARSTEIKRDKGIGGYTKRHRAANPEMYPTPKAQPAPKLRDPSTEYSDDYSTWAAGRRDTQEQGVAEGQGHPSDNDMGTTTGGTKMSLGQWKQMWMKKMPNADFATLFRSPPSMSGSAIAYFDGWMNNPDARWDPVKRVAEGGFDDASPMTKDTVKSDRIRSLKNLIAIAKEKGRQLRVQELELELKKLQGVAEGRTK